MDKLFQEHFTQTQVSIDHEDKLWSAIEQQRQPSKKHPVWWWFLAIGVLVSGAAWWAVSTPDVAKQPEKISPSIPVKEEVKPVDTKPIAEAHIDKKEVPLSNEISKKESTTTQKSLLTKSTYIQSTPTQVANPRTASTEALSIPNQDKAELSQKSAVVLAESKDITPKPASSLPQTRATMLTIANMARLDGSNNTFLQLAEPRLEIATFDDLPKNSRWDKCQVKEPGTFFLKSYGQASWAFEKFTQQEGDINETPTYLESWKEKFSPFLSYQGGVQVGYQFPWNGYVSGGVAYQHFQTKYESTQRVVEQITVYDEMAYFYIDDNGQTVWVADSVRVTNIYDQKEVHPNNHQMWHIPIQLGYNTRRNNFRIGANVEALFNISKSYEGYFMEANRSVIKIDSAQDKDYMSTTIGLSFSAGLHLGYLLNDHWEIYCSPRFRFNPNSFLADNQTLQISRNFAGLRAGVQYHF